jgi:hypothetical protein
MGEGAFFLLLFALLALLAVAFSEGAFFLLLFTLLALLAIAFSESAFFLLLALLALFAVAFSELHFLLFTGAGLALAGLALAGFGEEDGAFFFFFFTLLALFALGGEGKGTRDEGGTDGSEEQFHGVCWLEFEWFSAGAVQ